MSDVYQSIDDARVSQGDIVEMAPHAFLPHPLQNAAAAPSTSTSSGRGEEHVIAICKRSRAIVLTHDCVIDKPSNKYCQICPVVPLSNLPGAQHGDIRKNRIYRYLHLPARGETLPECVVDFSIVTTVEKTFLDGAKRIVTLTDAGRLAMYAQYIRWVTRWELRTIDCPTCGTEFDASLALPVRTE